MFIADSKRKISGMTVHVIQAVASGPRVKFSQTDQWQCDTNSVSTSLGRWLAIVLSDGGQALGGHRHSFVSPCAVLVVYARIIIFGWDQRKWPMLCQMRAGESVERKHLCCHLICQQKLRVKGSPTTIVVVAGLNKGNYIQRRREASRQPPETRPEKEEYRRRRDGPTDSRQARAEAIVQDVPVFLFDSVCYEFKQGFEVCHQRGARNPLSGHLLPDAYFAVPSLMLLYRCVRYMSSA